MSATINVPWPASPLGEAGFRSPLEDLATKAESLIGKVCRPQQSAELTLELVGLLWPVLGAPETLAGTCPRLAAGWPSWGDPGDRTG